MIDHLVVLLAEKVHGTSWTECLRQIIVGVQDTEPYFNFSAFVRRGSSRNGRQMGADLVLTSTDNDRASTSSHRQTIDR